MKIEIESFMYKGVQLENGQPCPHCSRNIDIYQRNLTRNHAQCLVNMYKKGQNIWQHYKDFCPDGFADYGKLKYWGLIESKENTDHPEMLDSGMWKLTYSGIEFLFGRYNIPKYLFTYNDNVVEVKDGQRVSFSKLYGERLDFRETSTRVPQLSLNCADN